MKLDRAKAVRPSPSMAVAIAALFVALGGTAWAVATVGPQDIQDDAVRARHIAAGSVHSGQIDNEGVFSADVRDGQVASRDIRNQTVRGADVADGSLTGADVADSSLSGSDIDAASLDVGIGIGNDRTLNNCDPDTETFIACGSTTFTGTRGEQGQGFALAIATVEWQGNLGGSGGTCRLRLTGDGNSTVLKESFIGETQDTTANTSLRETTMLAPFSIPAGVTRSLHAECREHTANIQYDDVSLVVIGDVAS